MPSVALLHTGKREFAPGYGKVQVTIAAELKDGKTVYPLGPEAMAAYEREMAAYASKARRRGGVRYSDEQDESLLSMYEGRP